MGFWERAGTAFATGGLSELGGARTLGSLAGKDILADPGAEAEKQRKQQLYGQADAAGRFADQGQQAWGGYQQAGLNSLAGLQRIASGQDSVSAMQLRQGLAQALAQQRSLAAGAAPQDAAGAARTAAIQSGRLAAGMSGQQALAGIQERQQAARDAAGLISTMGGQAANIALGSRQTATTGYGAGNAGAPEKSWLEKYGPAIQGGASSAAALSDRRAKTDIRSGDAEANRAIDGLKAIMFRYKSPNSANNSNVAPGAPRLGVAAQDLERAGLGHTVVDTPKGKQVNGADLATANTGMIAALGRRLSAAEDALGQRQPAAALPASSWYTSNPDLAAMAAQQQLMRRRALLAASAPIAPPQYWNRDTGATATYSTDAGGQ